MNFFKGSKPETIRLKVGIEGKELKTVVFEGAKLGAEHFEECVLFGKKYSDITMSFYIAESPMRNEFVTHFKLGNEYVLQSEEISDDYKDESIPGMPEITLMKHLGFED